jgi:hypothetical protein
MVYSDLLQNPLIVPVKKLREVATSLLLEAFVAQQEQYIKRNDKTLNLKLMRCEKYVLELRYIFSFRSEK